MIDINLLKSDNEKIYQAIKNQFNMANNEAGNYKDSIKNTKLKENTNNAILQARQLKGTFDKQMMDALTANKAEYLAAEAEKNKPVEFTNDNAQQLIFQEIQRNNKLLITNSVLSNGNALSIEEHLDKHIDDAEVKNMINYFIKGKSSEDQINYKSITSKIMQSNITPLDEIESMLGQARLHKAYSDSINTDTFPHMINQDFPVKYNFDDDDNNFFK